MKNLSDWLRVSLLVWFAPACISESESSSLPKMFGWVKWIQLCLYAWMAFPLLPPLCHGLWLLNSSVKWVQPYYSGVTDDFWPQFWPQFLPQFHLLILLIVCTQIARNKSNTSHWKDTALDQRLSGTFRVIDVNNLHWNPWLFSNDWNLVKFVIYNLLLRYDLALQDTWIVLKYKTTQIKVIWPGACCTYKWGNVIKIGMPGHKTCVRVFQHV